MNCLVLVQVSNRFVDMQLAFLVGHSEKVVDFVRENGMNFEIIWILRFHPWIDNRFLRITFFCAIATLTIVNLVFRF